jgi:hypothetical protein
MHSEIFSLLRRLDDKILGYQSTINLRYIHESIRYYDASYSANRGYFRVKI